MYAQTKCNTDGCYIERACGLVPDLGLSLIFSIDDDDTHFNYVVKQKHLLMPGQQHVDEQNCYLAVRPQHKLGDEDLVFLGSLFLQDYYLFLSIEDAPHRNLFVGIGEVNPVSVIAEQHYNPNTDITMYLPEWASTD